MEIACQHIKKNSNRRGGETRTAESANNRLGAPLVNSAVRVATKRKKACVGRGQKENKNLVTKISLKS